MSLNLSNATGTFTHHIRYAASTSSWSMSRTDGQNGQLNFTFTAAIADLPNILTGWCHIAEGAFDWKADESITKPAPKPVDGREWKRGFKLCFFSKTLFGEEPIRELCTSGTGVVKSIEALYAQYEAERGANDGKVPVVEYKGSVPLKVGKGNTTVPTLVITKWVDRPSELDATPVQASAPVEGAKAAPAASASEF